MSQLKELAKLVKKTYGGKKIKPWSVYCGTFLGGASNPFPNHTGDVTYVGYYQVNFNTEVRITNIQGYQGTSLFTVAESATTPLVFKNAEGISSAGQFIGYAVQLPAQGPPDTEGF